MATTLVYRTADRTGRGFWDWRLGMRRCVLGTPQQKTGEFYRMWTAKELAQYWFRSLRKTSECERIPKNFLEMERKTKPEAVIRPEYEYEFEQDGQSLLQPDDVDRLFQRPSDWSRREE